MSARLAGERGSGILSVTLGVGVVLTLLLVAAHLLTHLYATSVVEAAAYDAAVEAAGAAGDVGAAEARARETMGPFAASAAFHWSAGEEAVTLRVEVARPGLVPARFASSLGLTSIEREFRVRTERLR